MVKLSKMKIFLLMKSHFVENGVIFLNGNKLNGLQFLKESQTLKFSKEKSNLEILLKAI